MVAGTTYIYAKDRQAPPKTPKQVETGDTIGKASDTSEPSDKTSDKDSEIVIKTKNKTSEKESDEMMREVDRQLDSLIKALDELESLDTKQLPNEEGK